MSTATAPQHTALPEVIEVVLADGTRVPLKTFGLSAYRIESLLSRTLESDRVRLNEIARKSQERERGIDLRVERQRIVGKLKKANLRTRTQDDSFRSWGWDVDLERKHAWSNKPGDAYSITFRDEQTELRAVAKLKSVEGLEFEERIVEQKSWGETEFSLVRRYTVKLAQ